MRRMYCDVCNAEIKASVTTKGTRFCRTFRGKVMVVELLAGVGTSVSTGDLCLGCVIDFINANDERPKAASEPYSDVVEFRTGEA